MGELIRGNSGSFQLGVYLQARLNWWEDYSIEENYSVISCEMEMLATENNRVSTWYPNGTVLVQDQALVQLSWSAPATHQAALKTRNTWVKLSPNSAQGKEMPWVSEKPP